MKVKTRTHSTPGVIFVGSRVSTSSQCSLCRKLARQIKKHGGGPGGAVAARYMAAWILVRDYRADFGWWFLVVQASGRREADRCHPQLTGVHLRPESRKERV